MKINNRFISRLFAGLVIATVITTSVPVSAYAEEVAPASEVVAVQEGVDTEAAVENTFENTEVSEAEVKTDISQSEADEVISSEDETEAEESEDVYVPDDAADTSEKVMEDQMDFSFEEMTEAAQAALPLSSVITETSQYGPTKIQWRTSATDPYVPNTSAGTIRFMTQNPSSPLYASQYWTGWEHLVKQECGTACHSMALSYLNINKTGGQLLTLGGGASLLGNSFTTGITNLPYGTQWGSNPSATQLQTCINNYLKNVQKTPKYSPVFFHVSKYPALGGGVTSHYMLVIGYKGGNTYETLDPWDNTVTSVTFNFSGSRALASYTAGNTTVVNDEVDEFYQFLNPAGSVGSSGPTTPDPAPSTPTETVVKVDNKDGVVLANEVNIRKGPSTSYTIITTVNRYKKVVIVGKTTDWYKIKFSYNGVTKTGYISREYVGVGNRPSTVSFSLKKYYGNRIKISWKKQAGVTGYKVQRYSTKTKKYNTIKTLVGDSKLSFTDSGLTNGTTYKYRVIAYKTWVHTKSYTLNGPYPTPKSMKASSYVIGVTTGSQLNVRKGPGTNYGILKTLSKSGVEVRVYALTNSWYKIKLKISGVWKTGYISKSYVKI